MHISTIILTLGLLLPFSVDFVTSVPIAAPAFEWQAQTVQSAAVEFDPNQRAEVEDFIQSNGITGQDIEEYQRMSGFNPPADAEMGDERTLGLYYKLKYWNQSMYYRFRQWIESRRRTTTSQRPLIIINNFDSPSYGKTFPNRH